MSEFGDYGEFEEEVYFIDRKPNSSFEIFSGYIYQDEPYVIVIKNGYLDNKTKGWNDHKIMNRISLLNPMYIQYDELLTKDECLWFNESMHIHWKEIVEQLQFILKEYLNIDFNHSIQCPDYSQLSILV